MSKCLIERSPNEFHRIIAFRSVPFPYMVLLASGGHCILGIVEDVDKFCRLGETKDIAPGEAFDKVSLAFVRFGLVNTSHLVEIECSSDEIARTSCRS